MIALKTISASALLAACLAVCPDAVAQAPGDGPDPTSVEGKQAEGKARYQRGVDAYAAGRFKDAIDLFLQADQLAPSAALSFNIARAYEKISDDAATLQWYRDFQRRAPDAKNAAEVGERVQALEAALASKGVQQLSVLSSPLGATVTIDDQPVGITPFTGQFSPGAHRVLLSLRGYADSERKLELGAEHAQDLTIPLVPAAERQAKSGVPAGAGAGGAADAPTSHDRDQPNGPRFGIWPWVGLGAGAAALGGGLAFEMARRTAESDAESDHTQVGRKDKLDRMQSHQTTARVLTAVGGALVVTGGILLVIDLTSRPKSSAQATLGCAQAGCGFGLQGKF